MNGQKSLLNYRYLQKLKNFNRSKKVRFKTLRRALNTEPITVLLDHFGCGIIISNYQIIVRQMQVWRNGKGKTWHMPSCDRVLKTPLSTPPTTILRGLGGESNIRLGTRTLVATCSLVQKYKSLCYGWVDHLNLWCTLGLHVNGRANQV